MTISAIAITFVFLLVQGFISSDWARPLSGLVAGGITFYAGYLLAKRDAIGMGDVKLLTSLTFPRFT
jgi:Flp pilus assembly protein protease CpaA